MKQDCTQNMDILSYSTRLTDLTRNAPAGMDGKLLDRNRNRKGDEKVCMHPIRDGEVPSQKELSSYFKELFNSKVPPQKELSSSNQELFPNPASHL